MVMFKTKFQPEPAATRPQAQQQQQPQPTPPQPTAPPIEEERGPQYPIREPGPTEAPERARSGRGSQKAGSERPR